MKGVEKADNQQGNQEGVSERQRAEPAIGTFGRLAHQEKPVNGDTYFRL
jgi:hypothetical protein